MSRRREIAPDAAQAVRNKSDPPRLLRSGKPWKARKLVCRGCGRVPVMPCWNQETGEVVCTSCAMDGPSRVPSVDKSG